MLLPKFQLRFKFTQWLLVKEMDERVAVFQDCQTESTNEDPDPYNIPKP